jgi:hypothetical protein
LTECSLQCVDTRTDDYNCGSCGTLCDAFPADACSPMPTQTIYGCGESACGALKCKSGYADCNKDLKELCNSDGCEANLDTDVENCGSCGVKCGPGQVCRDDGFGPQCQDPCEKAGLATCAQGCADLLSDPYNCGACSNFCPWPGAHQLNSCKKGLCAYECEDGYADCNNDPLDGCEVDLRIHPANCGACGNECRHGEGQPCIAGKCLMVECDGGAETR